MNGFQNVFPKTSRNPATNANMFIVIFTTTITAIRNNTSNRIVPIYVVCTLLTILSMIWKYISFDFHIMRISQFYEIERTILGQ